MEKEVKKIEDKNFQEFWREKNRELEQKDLEDKAAYKQRCQNLNDYHKKQTDQKQKQLENEILKEFEDAQRMKAAIEDEDKIFNSYAAKALAEWDANVNNNMNLFYLLFIRERTSHLYLLSFKNIRKSPLVNVVLD